MKNTIIIAEAGVNHNGSLDMAKALIDAAADAGADYVKFQTFKADKLVSKAAKKAAYQSRNTNDGNDSQYDMLKKLEMPEEWHYVLIDYAKSKHINFLSTGFDVESIDFLERLNMPFYKVPSGEITNKPYLQHIARKGKPIILSTGMAELSEIADAISVIESEGVLKKNITVLHCNTEYPTPMDDVNLLAMNTIRQQLNVTIGYSDHTLGIEVPIAAVALGAVVIEKHFTLDRTLPGPDHLASLEPGELKAMVTAIRNIEKAISGTGVKIPSASEIENKKIGRKSIHYACDLPQGCILSGGHFKMMRPGYGISPMLIDNYIGRVLAKEVKEDQMLEEDNF